MVEIIPNWHPIFVHFTVALFSLATGLYVLSLLLPKSDLRAQWLTVARWNLWLGMGLTVITLLSGIYAYNTVVHDTPSHLAMTDHRNWAIATAVLFAAATLWSLFSYRAGRENSALFIAVLVVATLSLGATAWRGGELVYRFGLGVMALPNTGDHGHGAESEEHAHGEDEGTGAQNMSADEDSAAKPAASPQPAQSAGNIAPHEHHDDSAPHTH